MLRSTNENSLRKILANPYSEIHSRGEKFLFLQQLLLLDQSDLFQQIIEQARHVRNLEEISEDLETFRVSAAQQERVGRLKTIIDGLVKNAQISASAKASVPAATASVVPAAVPVFNPAAYHSQPPVLAHSPAFPELPDFNHSLLQQSYGRLAIAKRYEFLSMLFNHIPEKLWHDIIHTQFISVDESLKALVNDVVHGNMFSSHPKANKFLEEVQVYIVMRNSSNDVSHVVNMVDNKPDNRLSGSAPAAATAARASYTTDNARVVDMEHHDPIDMARKNWILKFQAFLRRPANTQKRKTENTLVRLLINVLIGGANPESLILHEKYCEVFGSEHMQRLAKDALTFIEHNCANNEYSASSLRRW